MANMTNAVSTRPAQTPLEVHHGESRGRRLVHANWLGGVAGWVWLAIVLIPLYWIVVTSFKEQSSYFGSNPLAPPTSPTFENYKLVVEYADTWSVVPDALNANPEAARWYGDGFHDIAQFCAEKLDRKELLARLDGNARRNEIRDSIELDAHAA